MLNEQRVLEESIAAAETARTRHRRSLLSRYRVTAVCARVARQKVTSDRIGREAADVRPGSWGRY